jgi:hypothetical protein
MKMIHYAYLSRTNPIQSNVHKLPQTKGMLKLSKESHIVSLINFCTIDYCTIFLVRSSINHCQIGFTISCPTQSAELKASTLSKSKITSLKVHTG